MPGEGCTAIGDGGDDQNDGDHDQRLNEGEAVFGCASIPVSQFSAGRLIGIPVSLALIAKPEQKSADV